MVEESILGRNKGGALKNGLGRIDFPKVLFEGVLGFDDAMDLCFLAAKVDVVTVGGLGFRHEVVR